MTGPKNNNGTWGWKQSLERLIALGLALLLLRSAFAHLNNPFYFLSTIYSYQLVNVELGKFIASTLPPTQILLAFALLVPAWVRPVYCGNLLLFLGFGMAQALALRAGLDISCGCFGADASLPIGAQTLAVAGGAALACIVGYLLAKPRVDIPAET
jgi:hypothetical protein